MGIFSSLYITPGDLNEFVADHYGAPQCPWSASSAKAHILVPIPVFHGFHKYYNVVSYITDYTDFFYKLLLISILFLDILVLLL